MTTPPVGGGQTGEDDRLEKRSEDWSIAAKDGTAATSAEGIVRGKLRGLGGVEGGGGGAGGDGSYYQYRRALPLCLHRCAPGVGLKVFFVKCPRCHYRFGRSWRIPPTLTR